jgi:hypothetical protein
MANKIVHVCKTDLRHTPVPMLDELKEPPDELDLVMDSRCRHA